jgi:hypothetical protein
VPTSAPSARPGGLDLDVSPNPARGHVSIRFTAAVGEMWRATVVDAAGRKVRPLGSGSGSPGTLRWDARDAQGRTVPAGVYWVRVTVGDRDATRRLVLLEGPSRGSP